jgi:hypothetical protein
LQLMSALVSQKREIERQLASVKQDLLLKAEAERMLNESLKEALGLLRPLQMHLETAEKEKKVVSKQLRVRDRPHWVDRETPNCIDMSPFQYKPKTELY